MQRAAEPSTPPTLIDTHCHLDDEAFNGDRSEVLSESVRVGVRGWVNIGFSHARWRSTTELAANTPGMVHSLGIHPQRATEWSSQTRMELHSLLQSSHAVALGEIGLDYANDIDRKTQCRAFVDQLNLARQLKLAVVIHQRAAEEDLVDILSSFDAAHPLLLHSFDGGEQIRVMAGNRGYLIGVGGLATRKNSAALRDQLIRVPLTSMVLETDSPYLLPAGQRGRRNTPAQLAEIARFLAELKGVPVSTVASVTTENAKRFFQHWQN